MAAKQDVRSKGTELPFFNLVPVDFAVTAKQRFEESANVQSELLKAFQETNEHWRDRIVAEAKVEGDFASRLAAAQSIPDAMATCQQWGTRHLEMMAEDARHLFDDTQKFVQTGARLFANVWATRSA